MNWRDLCEGIYGVGKMVEKGYRIDVVNDTLILTLEGKDILEFNNIEDLLESI